MLKVAGSDSCETGNIGIEASCCRKLSSGGGDIGDSSKPAKTADIAVIASAGETHG